MSSSELPSAIVSVSEIAQQSTTGEGTSPSSSTPVDHAMPSRVVDITPACHPTADSSTQTAITPLQTSEPIPTHQSLDAALDAALIAALAWGRLTPGDPPLSNIHRPSEAPPKADRCECCECCLLALGFLIAFVVTVVLVTVSDAKKRRNGVPY